MVNPISAPGTSAAQAGSPPATPAEIASKILNDNKSRLSGYNFGEIKRGIDQLTLRDKSLGEAVLAEINIQLKTTTNRAALANATYGLTANDGGGITISNTGPTVRDYFEGKNGTNNPASRAHYARLDRLWGDGNPRTDDVGKIDAGVNDLIKSGLTLAQYEAIKAGPATASSAESSDPATVALDLLQMGLDIAGIIDQTGASDVANGLISLGRGNWGDAALSLVAVVPVVGGLAVLGKLGKWPQKIANAIQLAANNPAARAILEPALKKIHDALSAVPNSVINALPEGVRTMLGGIKNKLDDFFGVAGKKVDDIVEVGGKHYVRYTGTGPLFRGDTRSPSEIFATGFTPKGGTSDLADYVKNHVDSIFVSTSKSPDVVKGNYYTGGSGGYVYDIDPSPLKGVDVNQSLGKHSLDFETEVAFPGGVPKEAIRSARQVMPDGTLGPKIRNPHFSGIE